MENLPNITIYGTVSLLELLWLAVVVPGFVHSVANAWDARVDYYVLRYSGVATHRDWVIARQRARHAITTAGVELMFVTFGAASAVTPNPPHLSWLAYVISGVLIGASLLLTWTAWRDSCDRREIRKPDY